MKALFFGSVGTLVDSSQLQLDAFNAAFKSHELNWRWEEDYYRSALTRAGGQNRIRQYAGSLGDERLSDELVQSIHTRKTELYDQWLGEGRLSARPGVVRVIESAKAKGIN